jgi:hypothetical protein
MEVTVYSVGDADNRPEWNYEEGERVEILTSLTEKLGTVVRRTGKYIRVRLDGGAEESFYPGEIRRI